MPVRTRTAKILIGEEGLAHHPCLDNGDAFLLALDGLKIINFIDSRLKFFGEGIDISGTDPYPSSLLG